MYTLSIKEQKPLSDSIVCECSIDDEHGGGIVYNRNMYFVCDLDRNVIQYFNWLLEYKEDLKKLGYNFEL